MTQKIHMVEWPGGEMPVPEGTPVIVKRRYGTLTMDLAGDCGCDLEAAFWRHRGFIADIVAYAVVDFVTHPAGTDLSKIGGE